MNHLGGSSWAAFDVHPPGESKRCTVHWQPQPRTLRDSCGGRTFPADGTGLTRLTTNAGGDYVPVFSPDATKIAFTNDSNPPSCNYACPIHVYVMNADGTSQVAIAPADVGTQAELPAWQPIGRPDRR